MHISLLLRSFVFLILLCSIIPSYGQDSIQVSPKRFVSFAKQTERKAKSFQKKLTHRTDKAISKLIRQEKKLKNKLAKVDSLASTSLFSHGLDTLQSFRKLLKSKILQIPDKNSRLTQYFPKLDTAKCLLNFVQAENFIAKSKGVIPPSIQKSLLELTTLEKKLQYTGQLEQYIKNRKAELSSILSKYKGIVKYDGILKKWGKEYYYYTETLKNYKTIFNEPTRAQEAVLKLANKLPSFKDFMKKNGELTSLFNKSNSQNLSGLQTRGQVQDLINGQMASFGNKGKELVSQKMSEAKEMLTKAIGKIPIVSDASTIPDFKPNNQKTKTLWQRIEYGSDLQLNRKSKEFPTSASMGFNIGYKLTDKARLGIGISTNLNIGNNWKKPAPVAEQLCFRSYVEFYIAKEFYLRGGWERQFTQSVTNLEFLDRKGFFRESALLGISRKIIVPGKIPLLKKPMNGRVTLMYDFFHNQHAPTTPAVVFRIGYNI
jgi:hypothetical protein